MSIALVSLGNNATVKLEMQGLKIHNSQSMAQRLVWTNIDKKTVTVDFCTVVIRIKLKPSKAKPSKKNVVR